MAGKISNNIKFYIFIDILNKYSDENNPLSLDEINSYMLEKLSVRIDRRTAYAYIEDLKQLGIDVSTFKENKQGYYIRNPKLEEYELKIILDCLSANKCITYKKTKEIQDKLYELNNIYVKYGLAKTMLLEDRSKSQNEEVFYNIDKIYKAIAEQKKIEFNYCEFTENRELVLRRNSLGKIRVYKANPISLVIKNDYYYLLLNMDKHNDLSFYRIDRIKNVTILEEDCKDKSLIKGCNKEFNPINYTNKVFKMYGGNDEYEIHLEILDIWIKHYIIDELGENVKFKIKDNGQTIAIFKAFYSEGLLNWILSLGESVRVLKPEKVKKDLDNKINRIEGLYIK